MNKKSLFTTAWNLARKAAADLGTSVKSQFAAALKAAWAVAKAPVAEAVKFVAPRVDGAIRGGGSGGSAWVARVTGTHPKFHLDREFLDKDQEHVSRSRRSGWFTWVLDRPGYYEIRDVQYEAGVASIGRLDRGFLRVDQAGEVTRVTKDHVIAAMKALEAVAA
jgi:hypothetical protein